MKEKINIDDYVIKRIPIDMIKISKDRRMLCDNTSLVESIRNQGLLSPIIVTDENVLVTGLHRLKACETLGREKIPAIVVTLNEVDAELFEIDENLERNELSAIQRADLLLRRKILYEIKYPYTKRGKYHRQEKKRDEAVQNGLPLSSDRKKIGNKLKVNGRRGRSLSSAVTSPRNDHNGHDGRYASVDQTSSKDKLNHGRDEKKVNRHNGGLPNNEVNSPRNNHNGHNGRYGSDGKSRDCSNKTVEPQFELRPSFVEDTKRRTKIPPRTNRRLLSLASKLHSDVKKLFQGTPFENHVVDLEKLSKLDHDDQIKIAKMALEKPDVKLSKLIKVKIAEQTKAQVCDPTIAPKPTIKKADALSFLNSISPLSVNLLITEPPHDIEDLPSFIRKWIPRGLTRLTDKGQAYIISSANPVELYSYLDILKTSSRFTLTNILAHTGLNTSQAQPDKKYKNDWKAIIYLRGQDAEIFDCPIDEEQLDVLIDVEKGDLAERLIRHSTYPFDTILDPFAGDGTILRAITRLGRIPLGCETDTKALEKAEEAGCIVDRS